MPKPKKLKVRNWEKWQTYRRDRGQPPWIKIHRIIMRDLDWIELSDAQRGQLVCIWLLAADHDGEVPASPALIQKLCHLESEPDLQAFVDLGFLKGDATVASSRRQIDDGAASRGRQRDVAEAEAEEIREETTLVQPTSSKGWSDDVVHVDLVELAIFCDDFGIPYSEMNETLRKHDATELLPIP